MYFRTSKLFAGSLVSASACLHVYAYRGLQPEQVSVDFTCFKLLQVYLHTSLDPY